MSDETELELELMRLAHRLPAVHTYMKSPCRCIAEYSVWSHGGPITKVLREYEGHLYEVLQHLNDHHKWTRHQIAEWLDTLGIDLEFKDAESTDTIDAARE